MPLLRLFYEEALPACPLSPPRHRSARHGGVHRGHAVSDLSRVAPSWLPPSPSRRSHHPCVGLYPRCSRSLARAGTLPAALLRRRPLCLTALPTKASLRAPWRGSPRSRGLRPLPPTAAYSRFFHSLSDLFHLSDFSRLFMLWSLSRLSPLPSSFRCRHISCLFRHLLYPVDRVEFPVPH